MRSGARNGRRGSVLGPRDSESGLKFLGKLLDRFPDPGGLLGDGGHHALARVGLVPDQFDGGDDHRQMIIDVVPHLGEFAVQLVDLLGV